jgi:translation initiation factor IF-1
MSKEDLIEIRGRIIEALGGGQYSIQVDGNDTVLRARLGGKMKQKHIRVIPGDLVTVGVSPYDMSHGIITWRFK